MQPSGTFAPLLKATLILPSAIVQVEMSRMIGGAVRDRHARGDRVGRKPALGSAEGATRMPPPLVLTKCSETLPAAAAISAQSPMRPRWPEFRSATTATPWRPALSMPELHRLLAHHLAEAELAVDDGERVVFEHDLRALVRQNLARAQPVDVGGHANDAVRVVPDEVGLDQVMGDPLRRSRPRRAAAAAKMSRTTCSSRS